MTSHAIVGLELAPSVLRGVRVGQNEEVLTFETPIVPGGEGEALQRAIMQLGRDASIRIVLRGLIMAGTKLILQPLQDIGVYTEHMPMNARETSWEAVPLLRERTLLLGASRRELDSRLDDWGLTTSCSEVPNAIGLTVAALLTLESQLNAAGDWAWIDGDRSLYFRVESGSVRSIELLTSSANPRTVLGSDADPYAKSHLGVDIFRPAGLDPRFAVAFGATLWGTEAWPELPNLEPKDRRDSRQKSRWASRITKRVQASALTCLLLAGLIHGYGLYIRSHSEAIAEAISERRKSNEQRLASLASTLSSRITTTPNAEADIIDALTSLSDFAGDLTILGCVWKAESGRYSGLSQEKDRGILSLWGHADSIEAVERARASLAKSGCLVDVPEAASTARPQLPIDFRMTAR